MTTATTAARAALPTAMAGAVDRVRPVLDDTRERMGPLVQETRERMAPALEDARARVAPALDEARERISPVLDEAREKFGPRVQEVLDEARERLGPRVQEVVEQARPVVAQGVGTAVDRTSGTARELAGSVREDVLPKVAALAAGGLLAAQEAVESAGPLREEALSRGTAAVQALRGELPPNRPKRRRGRKLLLVIALGGAGFVAVRVLRPRRESEPWDVPVTPLPTPVPPSAQAPAERAATGSALGSTTDTSDVGGAGPDEVLADAGETPATPTSPDAPTTVIDLEQGGQKD